MQLRWRVRCVDYPRGVRREETLIGPFEMVFFGLFAGPDGRWGCWRRWRRFLAEGRRRWMADTAVEAQQKAEQHDHVDGHLLQHGRQSMPMSVISSFKSSISNININNRFITSSSGPINPINAYKSGPWLWQTDNRENRREEQKKNFHQSPTLK